MNQPKIKKGFLQVNISGFVFHPNTENGKQELDAMGDFIEIQPIMYDIFDLVAHSDLDTALKELPESLLPEIHSVLCELAKLIRLHRPNPDKIVPVGVRDPSIKQEKPKLLDAAGAELRPTKH